MKKNLVQTLRKNGKKNDLDISQEFYTAMAKTIYQSLDELDQQFIESSSNIAGRNGADMIAIIIVGQKMFTVVLGDMSCYLTKKIEVTELAVALNHVS